MSWGFWFTIIICVCSLYGAWIDHGETYYVFKSSIGKKRWNKGAKLVLIWGMPILATLALPFTVWESVQLNKQISALEVAQEPRVITHDQIKKFITATEKVPKGPVTVKVYYNESEPSAYARQIRNMLNDAGYLIGSHAGFVTALTPPKEPELGQFLAVSNLTNAPAFSGSVQKALESIGINAEGRESKSIPEGELWIFVGMKSE
jgi:hypothetical protein